MTSNARMCWPRWAERGCPSPGAAIGGHSAITPGRSSSGLTSGDPNVCRAPLPSNDDVARALVEVHRSGRLHFDAMAFYMWQLVQSDIGNSGRTSTRSSSSTNTKMPHHYRPRSSIASRLHRIGSTRSPIRCSSYASSETSTTQG